MEQTFQFFEKTLLFLFFLLLVLFFPERPWPQNSPPHLTFTKSLIVKKYRGGQVYTEPHKIKKGEYLWQILRKQYQMPNAKIAFYCTITRSINPGIKNINVLYPDQKILIPYKIIIDKTRDKTTAMSQPLSENKSKKIASQPEKGHEIDTSSFQQHTLLRGEYLSQILREKYNLPDKYIFSETCISLLKMANPEIKDFNTLDIGQKILIPQQITEMGKTGQTNQPVVAKKKASKMTSEVIMRQKPSKREQIVSVPEDQSILQKPTKDEVAIKEVLSSLARTFNAKVNASGTADLSLEGRGKINFDYEHFPLYELPWGKKILLDYGAKLPSDVQEVISAEWDNIEIVGVREKEDMESILDKILNACGFFKVEKDGRYIVSRDNIQISVSGKWIAFKDDQLKNVFIVNLVDNPSENLALTPSLKNYLSSAGVNLVHIPSGKIVSEGKNTTTKSALNLHSRVTVSSVKPDVVVLTDFLLDVLGKKYCKDFNTKIFQNMYDGFSFEILVDRMFEQNGEKYLIDFQNLPKRLYKIIIEQGYHILQINPHEKQLSSAIKALLDFCKANYTAPDAIFEEKKGEKAYITVTVPGFLIKTAPYNVMLTRISLKEEIAQFLLDHHNIRIVKY